MTKPPSKTRQSMGVGASLRQTTCPHEACAFLHATVAWYPPAMQDEHKRAAARAALDELPPQGIIGLGTGSTVRFFVEAIAERVAAGHAYVGVPTSKTTEEQARSLGI